MKNVSMAADSTDFSRRMMERAVALALNGRGRVEPNPMVGAVITAPDGSVIGEGWHRRFGGPHAEVNAIASVADEAALRTATMYVTLEPCSHYGKTPPCSELIIRKGIPRVVVGSPDPFPQVSGRGIAMLREAGVDVTEGFMRELTDAVNVRFITAHTLGRPYILLKWAETADGFMAGGTPDSPSAIQLSDTLTSTLVHRERAAFDAIMVGTATANIDNPRLDTRLWPGKSPRPVTFDIHGRLNPSLRIASDPHAIILRTDLPISDVVTDLYASFGVTSLMVEGGASLLRSFIAAGLYDRIRVETAPIRTGSGLPAPKAAGRLLSATVLRGRTIREYIR